MNNKRKDGVTVFIFLFVPVILLALFSYYPLVKLFELSFSDWNGLSSSYNYVGFSNYKEVIGQKDLWTVFANNGAYIITALMQQFIGLFLAIILNCNLKKKNFFRAVLFMPYIINGVAVVFMFNYLYDFTNSPINYILGLLGLGDKAIHFLGTSYWSNFSLAFISFWKYVGFTMVIFIAALQSIPSEIYEAARVDGAGFWQTITRITMPNIKGMFKISLLLSINGAFQAYFEPYMITKGGPNGRTDTFITKTLTLAFGFRKYGKAAVMGVMLLGIILLLVVVQKVFLKEGEAN
ncbi:carbohydrate ABC transporter permease [Anaerosporobacter sp.]|uniref:carbohydrate ABC transporter permease n=1 Tax=Anaerosporobacter sp. TaxID=1872529 RepID=UPI00286F5F57|nr:sugar ABC transporter permease [Anaerosporobacter sp.]